jgi:hypothetical protein
MRGRYVGVTSLQKLPAALANDIGLRTVFLSALRAIQMLRANWCRLELVQPHRDNA